MEHQLIVGGNKLTQELCAVGERLQQEWTEAIDKSDSSDTYRRTIERKQRAYYEHKRTCPVCKWTKIEEA